MYDSAKDLYDKMCEVLTNFEDPETEEERTTIDDLYSMLKLMFKIIGNLFKRNQLINQIFYPKI